MIISCNNDYGQDEFIKQNPKHAIFINDLLSLDDYIKEIKVANEKYDFVFTPSSKNQVLKDNSIRFYGICKKGEILSDTPNQIRLNKGETLLDKINKDEFSR